MALIDFGGKRQGELIVGVGHNPLKGSEGYKEVLYSQLVEIASLYLFDD